MVAAGAAALLGYSFLRQGQNTAATLTTARLVNFRVVRLRGFNLECEAQLAFFNSHPSRTVRVQSLGLAVWSERGAQIGTVRTPTGVELAANNTTAVPIEVSINLMDIAAMIDYSAAVSVLTSLTSVGKVLAWLTRQAGFRNCVFRGTAQLDGLVLPLNFTKDLGVFAPTPAKPVAPRPTVQSRGRALTQSVTA